MEISSYLVKRLRDLRLLVLIGDFKLPRETAWRFEVTVLSGDFKLLCDTAWRFEVTGT